MNSGIVLLSIISVLILINVGHAFAITENFLLLPDEQKTFNIQLNENQKIFFQIFVSGGTEDIHLKIIDTDTNFLYYDSIVRTEKENVGYDSIMFPAYKNEINNIESNAKNLAFTFDNTISRTVEKKIDFTYNVFTSNTVNSEQNSVYSWISAFLTIVVVIVIVIVVVVVIIKKLKERARQHG
jgi:hypothetical protein